MASRVLTQVYDKALKEAGITSTQFGLLGPLAMEGPMNISELATIQAMDRTTLTRNLRLVEKAGLIKIVPGDDRRTRIVKITPKGKKTFERSLPLWEEAQRHVTQALGNKQWKNLNSELSEITEKFLSLA